MKSTLALTLFATLAVQQVVLAQEDEEVNIATAPPAAVETPNIYWWTSLLTGDEIKNYLTEPATAAATGIPTADAATTTADAATATTAAASDATTSAEIEAATASASTSDDIASIQSAATSLASAESSLASAISDVSSSASSVAAYSTPSVVAWSSAASSTSGFIAPTSTLPRPSGSIIPPVTTSGSIQPANSGSLLVADLGKILFSVTVGAFLGNFLN